LADQRRPLADQRRPLAATKFEYRNPKFETNPKYKCSNVQNRNAAGSMVLVI
jgi:hypothetical protein